MATSASLPEIGTTVEFAGFWRRFTAYVLVDLPIQVVAGFALGAGIGVPAGVVIGLAGLPEGPSIRVVELIGMVTGFTFSWLYSAGFESSRLQATLGKLAFGMAVTDLEGGRIIFARATWRFLTKILSGLFLGLGFLMIPHNPNRQALHDDLAHTLVKKRAGGVPDNKQLQRTSAAQAMDARR